MLLKIIILNIVILNTPAHNLVGVIMTVKDYFNSGCVYITQEQNEEFQSYVQNVNNLKLLTNEGISTTMTSAGRDIIDCHQNRPLYVTFFNGRSNGTKITIFANNRRMSKAIWLVFLVKYHNLEEIFTEVNIPFDCEFLVVHKEGDKFVLMEIYRVDPSFPLQIIHLANWTSRGGIVWPGLGFYDRRNNLQGLPFKTLVKKIILNEDNKHGKYYFFYKLWKSLSKVLNFRIQYIPIDLEGNGIKLENGSWDGIVGILQRKEADATITSVTMTSHRVEVVDYLAPLSIDRKYVITRASTDFEHSWTSFLKPFSTKLWMALSAAVTLLAVSLSVVVKTYQNGGDWKENGILQSISYSLFFIFSLFCGQGEKSKISSWSFMLICTVTDMLVLVFLVSYSASLVSYLTIRRHQLPFRTFSDFLRDGTFTLGVQRQSSLRSFFETAKDPVIQQVYLKYMAPYKDTFPQFNLEGCQRVCSQNKYAYVYYLDYLEANRNNLECELTIVREAFVTVTKSIALTKHNPYLGVIRHNLNKLRRYGWLQKLQVLTKRSRQNQETLFISMDITAVEPIFAILLVGLIAAILCIIFEILIKNLT